MRRRIIIVAAALLGCASFLLAQSAAEQAEADEALAKAEARLEKLMAKADKHTLRMLEDLEHRKPEKRQAAAEFLGRLEVAGAVPGLIDLLSDREPEVRSAAAGALWRIGKPDAIAATPTLERVLAGDANGKVRISAAGALWTLGAAKAELIPHLEPVLADKSPYTRIRAADLLLEMGVAASRLLPTYEDAMASNSATLREYTVELLVDHDDTPEIFVPLLLEALNDPEESVRILAVLELSLLPNPGANVIEALRAATRDESQYVRSTALEAVGRAAPDAGAAPSPVVADLLRGLRDRKTDVRVGAADGLGEIKASSPEVVEALIAALSDKKNVVRAAAADALDEIGAPAGKPAIPHLWNIWNDSTQHWTVRHAAGRALGELGETVDWSSEG